MDRIKTTVKEYAAGEKDATMQRLYEALAAVEQLSDDHQQFARDCASRAYWALPQIKRAA